MRKLLSLVLTLSLVFGAMGLAAIAETADDLYIIEIITRDDAFTDSRDTVIGQYIAEKFGIVFKNVYYPGEIREKQSLALAAGDYGELVYLQRNDMVSNYINAGALLSLEPYLDQMPNFTARYADILGDWRGISEDGQLYKWEANVPTEKFESCEIAVRSDILELNDWKAPVTTSEYIDLLKRAKEAYPVTPDGLPTIGMVAPFAESWGLQGIAPILYEKGDHYPSLGNEGYIFDSKLDQFTDYFKNDGVKDSLAFFNELYREGLLDTESFTDLCPQVNDKLSSGQALSMWYATWEVALANAALIEAGLEDLQYVSLYIQSDAQAAAGEKRGFKVESSRPFDSYAMTIKCKQPERIIELLEWSAGDEGRHFLQEGVEGDLWEINADGVRVPTEKRMDMDKTAEKAYGLNSFEYLCRTYVRMEDGQYPDVMDEQQYIDMFTLTDRQREIFNDKLGWTSSNQWALENGTFIETGTAQSIQLDSNTEFGKLQQKMVETRVKWSAKLILAETAEQFEEIYQQAMAEYDLLDHQSVIDELNRLYSEAK